jgi:hypothetical protein
VYHVASARESFTVSIGKDDHYIRRYDLPGARLEFSDFDQPLSIDIPVKFIEASPPAQ